MRLRSVFPLAFLLGVAPLASAIPVVICTEDPVAGCIAEIPTSSPVLYVASDGEAPFSPFGIGVDVSDAIKLNANWAPDPRYADSFLPGFWTRWPGTDTWYLPASTPCGDENVPACEPVGAFVFTPGGPWAPGTPDELWLLEADGSLSDVIRVGNSGPNGEAWIGFYSDPNVIPEPGTLTLFGLGLAGLALKRTCGRA